MFDVKVCFVVLTENFFLTKITILAEFFFFTIMVEKVFFCEFVIFVNEKMIFGLSLIFLNYIEAY